MKRLLRNIFAALVLSAFCFGSMDSCQDQPTKKSHDSFFSNDKLLSADADALKTTVVTPHLQVAVKRDQNILWCGSFQLAWNEACKLAGGKLCFRPPVPGMVDVLNQKAFTGADLDEGSYLAMAGYVRDGILTQIPKRLREKFDGEASPHYLPEPDGQRPQDIVVYSYLFKNLEFPRPYERGQTPATFQRRSVECFGMGPEYKPGREAMAEQTLIHDYVSRDDFVIELKTKGTGDRLILAKVSPGKTLAETVGAVRGRLSEKAVSAETGDVLVVPKINFDITRSYGELVNLWLKPTTPQMASDLKLLTAVQNTRFQIDETGVRLRSESHISFGCSAACRPGPKHIMIFDRPYLVMMMRKDAGCPYFALWVGNADLLVTAD